MNNEVSEVNSFVAVLTLSIVFILGYAMPTLFGAWVLTLILPYSFSQVMWLTLGMIVVLSFVMLNASQEMARDGYGFQHHVITILACYLFLALSALLGKLFSYLPIDVSLFELTALFAISLTSGSAVLIKTLITAKFDISPMNILNYAELIDEDEIIKPKRRSRGRRSRR